MLEHRLPVYLMSQGHRHHTLVGHIIKAIGIMTVECGAPVVILAHGEYNTIFTDNYQAMWIDATFKPFEQDVYAAFESGVILIINFPVYQSQIRFSKVLE